MTEEKIRKVALGFLLLYMDEDLATRAARYCLTEVLDKNRQRQLSEKENNILLVYFASLSLKKFAKEKNSKPPHLALDGRFIFPKNLNTATWRQFHKQAHIDDLFSVIWSTVLLMPDEQVAEGLGVTIGTVRSRVGRGLMLLGNTANMGVPNAKT